MILTSLLITIATMAQTGWYEVKGCSLKFSIENTDTVFNLDDDDATLFALFATVFQFKAFDIEPKIIEITPSEIRACNKEGEVVDSVAIQLVSKKKNKCIYSDGVELQRKSKDEYTLIVDSEKIIEFHLIPLKERD